MRHFGMMRLLWVLLAVVPGASGVARAKCVAGSACKHGKTCVAPAPTPKHKHPRPRCVCAAPRKVCRGNCVALDSDPKNCGACRHACPAGQTCANGACVPPCASGQTRCGGQCVDLATDVGNCGACGVSCNADASGHACVDGTCGCRSLGDCPSTGCDAATDCSPSHVCVSDTNQCPASCTGDVYTPGGRCGRDEQAGMCVFPSSASCGPCHCGNGVAFCDCTCPSNCQAGSVCDVGTGLCCWANGTTGCSINPPYGTFGSQGDCCSGNYCVGDTSSAVNGIGNGLCCRPPGIACSSTPQCCPGYQCVGSVCCAGVGGSCDGGVPCCAGLSCGTGLVCAN